MGKIESQIGTRTFESSGGARNFSIPDETGPRSMGDADEPAPYGQQGGFDIIEERRRKAQEMNRINDSDKRRLEILAGIGRAKVDVPIENASGDVTTFSLRTLKGRENKYLIRHAVNLVTPQAKGGAEEVQGRSLTVLEVAYDLREITLAVSLYAIDGIAIDTVLNITDQDELGRVASRAAFIQELDDSIIKHLNDQYEKLTKNNSEKYSIKTEADAKEVAGQMKKSGEGA